MLNKIVIYQNKKYKVIWEYENGNCEIQELNSYTTFLIHKSELK